MTQVRKPVPPVDPDTRPFWEGCKRHELLLQRCDDCGAFRYPPRQFCGRCFSDNTQWVRASGRGTVYSYTVIRQIGHPAFRDQVPYVVAYVDLEEGVRMMSNIVQCPPERVHIGMPVEVVFEEVTDLITLPKFRPVA